MIICQIIDKGYDCPTGDVWWWRCTQWNWSDWCRRQTRAHRTHRSADRARQRTVAWFDCILVSRVVQQLRLCGDAERRTRYHRTVWPARSQFLLTLKHDSSSYLTFVNFFSPTFAEQGSRFEHGTFYEGRNCSIMSTGVLLLADTLPSMTIKIVAPFLPFYMLWVNAANSRWDLSLIQFSMLSSHQLSNVHRHTLFRIGFDNSGECEI